MRAILLFIILVLLGCLFEVTPFTEEPITSAAKDDYEKGLEALFNKQWDDAVVHFDKAIEADSSFSRAYYNYSKAVKYKYNLSAIVVDAFISQGAIDPVPVDTSAMDTSTVDSSATDSTTMVSSGNISLSFLKTASNQVLSNYLKATTLINSRLSILYHRDTTTQNFENDSTQLGGFTKDQFPLTDKVIGFDDYGLDLSIIQLIQSILSFQDLNNDTIVDNSDFTNELSNLLSDSLSGFQQNIGKVLDKLDSTDITDYNNALKKIADGSSNSATTINNFLKMTNFNIQEVSNFMSNTSVLQNIIFYQAYDSIDNDGDGCVDEEIRDNKDNDGDGLIDEDSRLKYDSTLYPSNFKNRNINTPDNSPLVVTNAIGRLNFTTSLPFRWSDDINSSNDSAKKVTDSLRHVILGYVENQTPTYSLGNDSLQTAQTLIGGCWKLY